MINCLKCEIVQTGDAENAFVVRQDNSILFRIHFPKSIIRRFYETTDGYILVFQCRAAIVKEKGNVCLVSPTGQILWWAERKKSGDCYVETVLQEQHLIGYDGSFNCWINLQNGKTEKREFVK
jgi:hypothetical protein